MKFSALNAYINNLGISIKILVHTFNNDKKCPSLYRSVHVSISEYWGDIGREDAGKKAAKADGNDRLGTQARATLFNRAVCLYKMRRYEESMMDLAYCYALKPGEDVEKKILELAQKIGERLAGVRHKEPCPEELVDKAESKL
jgi:hypothetical protein